MRRILLISTALVAAPGLAAAQGVRLSGNAEMGIVGGSRFGDQIQFHTDIDVTFTMSGETDNGLTFGATIDLDESDDDDAFNPRTQGGESVFLSGNFGTITMGDTDGAFDWALQELDAIASINDDHTSHEGYLGSYLDGLGDGQIVRYDYTFGDFSFAVSVEQSNETTSVDTGYAAALRYAGEFGAIRVSAGVGYQTGIVQAGGFDIGNTGVPLFGNTRASAIGGSVHVESDNGLSGGITLVDFDLNGGLDEAQHLGIGIAYRWDAFSVAANYGCYTSDIATLDGVSGFGVAANYELGGGAVVQFGYGSSNPAFGTDVNSFSFGVAMSF